MNSGDILGPNYNIKKSCLGDWHLSTAIFCPHVPGNGTTASLEITSLQKLEAIHLLTFEVEYAIEQPTPSSAAPFVCLP